MLPRKKWYTWTVLLSLVFLAKEYSSEVFQTQLAVSLFNKVAVKKLKVETVAQRCSVKKVFLKILQNSQENAYARVSFSIKLQAEGKSLQLY